MNFLLLAVIIVLTAVLLGLTASVFFHRIEDSQLELDGGFDEMSFS